MSNDFIYYRFGRSLCTKIKGLLFYRSESLIKTPLQRKSSENRNKYNVTLIGWLKVSSLL